MARRMTAGFTSLILACVLTGVSCHIWQWLDNEVTKIKEAQTLSGTSCKKVFHTADYLRALHLDFLNVIREEATETVDDIIKQLTLLGVDSKNVDDVKFVWGVTVDEINLVVNTSYTLVDDLVRMSGGFVCPLLLKHEEQSQLFRDSVSLFYKHLYHTKVEMRKGVSVIRSLIEEFNDFFMAMLQEPQIKSGEEETARLYSILKMARQQLFQHFAKIIKARKALIKDKLILDDALDHLNDLHKSTMYRVYY